MKDEITQKFLDWCGIMGTLISREQADDLFGPRNVLEFEKRFQDAWRQQFSPIIPPPQLFK